VSFFLTKTHLFIWQLFSLQNQSMFASVFFYSHIWQNLAQIYDKWSGMRSSDAEQRLLVKKTVH